MELIERHEKVAAPEDVFFLGAGSAQNSSAGSLPVGKIQNCRTETFIDQPFPGQQGIAVPYFDDGRFGPFGQVQFFDRAV